MVTKYHSSEAKARTHDPKTSWEAAEKVDTNRLERVDLKMLTVKEVSHLDMLP